MVLERRPASIKDVAIEAGVSVGTVSNVLNRPDKVAPETVRKVSRAIGALGFVRNAAASQLRAGRSATIGLIIPDSGNPWFADLAHGAEDAAADHRLSLLVGSSDGETDRERFYLNHFDAQQSYGVLIAPVGDVSSKIERLTRRKVASVFVDYFDRSSPISSVAVDDIAGGRLAVEHLIALGRRKIVLVGGGGSAEQVAKRLEGARQAARAGGAKLEVVDLNYLTVSEGQRVGAALARRADRPDGVFAVNDLVAIGLLESLVLNGVSVPEDVAVIGCDDIEFSQSSVVPLTSVRRPSELIGRTAVQLLVERVTDPSSERRDIVFQPELVVRASTFLGRGR